jgi:hypothetical protein
LKPGTAPTSPAITANLTKRRKTGRKIKPHKHAKSFILGKRKWWCFEISLSNGYIWIGSMWLKAWLLYNVNTISGVSQYNP